MKKPRKKSAIKRECDQLFSASVRALGYCELAGEADITCSGRLEAAHVVSRAIMGLRYDRNNILCLCSFHHRHYTQNPLAWAEVISRRFPEKYAYVQEHIRDPWDREYPLARLRAQAKEGA